MGERQCAYVCMCEVKSEGETNAGAVPATACVCVLQRRSLSLLSSSSLADSSLSLTHPLSRLSIAPLLPLSLALSLASIAACVAESRQESVLCPSLAFSLFCHTHSLTLSLSVCYSMAEMTLFLFLSLSLFHSLSLSLCFSGPSLRPESGEDYRDRHALPLSSFSCPPHSRCTNASV